MKSLRGKRTRFAPQLATAFGLLALLAPVSAWAQLGPDADLDGVPNEMDAFPCDPGPSGVVFYPGQGQFSTMFFEDQWPSKGDNDFNDVVLAYNYILTTDDTGRVYQMRLTVNAQAVGGTFNNGVAFSLPVPTEKVASITRQLGAGAPVQALLPLTTDPQLVVRLVDNVRQLYSNQAGPINSDPARGALGGVPLEVTIRFTEPVALNLAQAPFDLFIFRSENFGHQIHRPQYTGTAGMDLALFGSADDGSSSGRHFVDKDGLPFVLTVPASTPWPRESMPIAQLFPRIAGFAASGGTQDADFYLRDVQLQNAWRQGVDGRSSPAPSFVGRSDEPSNSACIVPWRQGGQQFGGSGNEYAWQTFAHDSQGNILVVGSTDGTIPGGTSAGWMDMFLLKFGQDGRLLWSRQAGTPQYDAAMAMTIDAQDNIYVGVSQYQGSSKREVLYKYDKDGTLLWSNSGMIGCTNVEPTALTIAPDGNVLMATGCSQPGYMGWGPNVQADLPYPVGGWGAVTAKLSSQDGSLIWARGGDTDQETSYGVSLVADSAGNSYTYVSHNGQLGQSIIKRDANGTVVFRRLVDDRSLWRGGQIRLSGNSLIVSRPYLVNINGLEAVGGVWDFYVGKVSAADGSVLWDRSLGTDGTEYAYASWRVPGPNDVDTQGNIYVAGTTDGVFPGFSSFGGRDYFLAKFDTNGNQQWVMQYGTDSDDFAMAAGWEPRSGAVFVGGLTRGAFPGQSNELAGNWDLFVMKHNPLTGAVQ